MPDASKHLNAAVRAAWESNAEWWDDYVGREGNEFHRVLVAPAQMRLLALTLGERVLEVACGNGQFAREMARTGAIVVASDFSEKFVEREDRDGEVVTVHGLRISKYLTPEAHRGLGIIGQPEPHYYFERPLSVLFGECFAAGFVLDGLEEPSFVDHEAPERPLSWDNYPEIPPVLVARLRSPGT